MVGTNEVNFTFFFYLSLSVSLLHPDADDVEPCSIIFQRRIWGPREREKMYLFSLSSIYLFIYSVDGGDRERAAAAAAAACHRGVQGPMRLDVIHFQSAPSAITALAAQQQQTIRYTGRAWGIRQHNRTKKKETKKRRKNSFFVLFFFQEARSEWIDPYHHFNDWSIENHRTIKLGIENIFSS